ncbi:hypothetical protein EDC04DRAFT_2869975 [Pisolithus marmoratus]|nr:hypothetical protein EDC04DRAFT_2869975 [Pisolithus marmoratus]
MAGPHRLFLSFVNNLTNTNLRIMTLQTIGYICESIVHTSSVPALVTGRQDNPRIVTNCCWALMSLANQPEFLEEESVLSQISHLSPYFDGIINALLRVMDTASNEENSHTSAYGAITSHVTHAMNDVMPVIQNTLITILMQMQQLLGVQIVGIDDRNNWNEPQSNLCSVVIVNITIFQFDYRHLTLVRAAGKTSTVLEDALVAVRVISFG